MKKFKPFTIMKKTLMTLLVMLCAAAAASAATTFTIDGLKYTNQSGTVVQVSGYETAPTGELVIPGQVTYNGTTYTVNRIGYNAFRNCSDITSVVLPNTVTVIDFSAFGNCSNLTSISLPSGLVSIGSGAFQYCTSLTSLTIPASVTSIAGEGQTNTTNRGPVYGCDNLETLVVEAGNTVYDSRDNCNAIVKTATNTMIFGCKGSTFPASVTTIGKGAFKETTIENVTISEGVTTLETFSFYHCRNLKSLNISSTVSTIGSEAFTGCPSLESIVVADANATFDSRDNCNAIIKTADDELILGCVNTEIPATVKAVGYKAFTETLITDITLPEGVTTLKPWALSKCGMLKTVVLPSTLTDIQYGAFQECNSLTDIYAYPHANSVTLGGDVWAFMDETLWTSTDCTLHVYPEDFDYYSTADQWKEFTVIGDLGEPATGKPGDANGDGDVNVNDVTVTINYILDKNPTPFVFENADVDGDGAVNVMDVTAIINLILNNN